MKRPGRRAAWIIAAALIAAVLLLGGIRDIGIMLSSVRGDFLLKAAMASAASLAFRGFRLSLLLKPGELNMLRAFPLTAVAQVAAAFIPARAGELALPLLLKKSTGRDTASGIAILLAARSLDTAALGAWALASLLFRRGAQAPLILAGGLLLFLPLILLPTIVSGIDNILLRREEKWSEKTRAWVSKIHRVREGLEPAFRHPTRLGLAALACLASWFCQWILTWNLLAAMGYRWPAWDVVAGAAAASLSNLIPLSIVANFGTLEAGWTAAFTAMGIPASTAAATGLATHVWALVLAATIGLLSWPFLPRLPRTNEN